MPVILVQTIARFQPEPARAYPIEFVAHLTGVPRHRIAVYCRTGIIAPEGDPNNGGWRFSADEIALLRAAERVREQVGDNPAAIKLVLALLRRNATLEERLRRGK